MMRFRKAVGNVGSFENHRKAASFLVCSLRSARVVCKDRLEGLYRRHVAGIPPAVVKNGSFLGEV